MEKFGLSRSMVVIPKYRHRRRGLGHHDRSRTEVALRVGAAQLTLIGIVTDLVPVPVVARMYGLRSHFLGGVLQLVSWQHPGKEEEQISNQARSKERLAL